MALTKTRSARALRRLSKLELDLLQEVTRHRMVRALRHDGTQVLQSLIPIASFHLEHPHHGACVLMLGIELQDQGELFARALQVATDPEKAYELHSDVMELRTKTKGTSILVDRILGSSQLEIGLRKRAVGVCHLSSSKGVIGFLGTALCSSNRSNGRTVLTELIAGDCQVEGRFQVFRVQLQRLLEAPARFGESTGQMVDHAQVIEDIRIADLVLNQLFVVRLSERVLGASKMLVCSGYDLTYPVGHVAEGIGLGRREPEISQRQLGDSFRSMLRASEASSLSGNRSTSSLSAWRAFSVSSVSR